MNSIALICKRRPQQRDLRERPYGRYWNLPRYLSDRGHRVHVILISHYGLPSSHWQTERISWLGVDVLGPRALRDAWRAASQSIMQFRPDWIIGGSDAWYGWMAHSLARRVGARVALDAYDNYEAYMAWNLPLHWAWRRAVATADLVTVAGPQLGALLGALRTGRTPPVVVPMAADAQFVQMNRLDSRRLLGLPVDVPLFGYFGGWADNRGTSMLRQVLRTVREAEPRARLVVTGRPPSSVIHDPGVICLGYLDDSLLPAVTNAVNVSCVVTADSAFGRYSYPAKLCEAIACGTAVAATATQPVRWMLADDSRFLCPVGDADEMAALVLRHIHSGPVKYPPIPTWDDVAMHLETALLSTGAS